MQAYFLRHGEAARAPGMPDEERPLTPHGRAQALAIGRVLTGARIIPELVVTSPLLRAQETAELACPGAPGVQAAVTPFLLPDADPGELVAAYADARASVILFVGHQPFIGEAVAMLLGEGMAPALDIATATLVGLVFDGPLRAGRGQLDLFLPARYLPQSHPEHA